MFTTNIEDIKLALTRYFERESTNSFSLKSALVDMDGVLYDSMPKHARAWVKMMHEIGIECPENLFFLYEGMTGAAIINKIFKINGREEVSAEETKRLYSIKARYFSESGEPNIMPDTFDILSSLRDSGVKRVLVTGSGQASVLDKINRDYPGIFPDDMRITAHDVEKGKPDAEPYLKGMELAGTKFNESIVIENAPLGIQAGRCARCFVIGITTGPIPETDMWNAGADLLFPSMKDFYQLLPDIITILKCEKQ